jgi:hypothetical protein
MIDADSHLTSCILPIFNSPLKIGNIIIFMKYLFTTLCIIVLLIPYESSAQKKRQELGLACYNIGFGGITAGLGAMLNKKKGTKSGKEFLRGFKHGCIGGAINYTAKRVAYGMNPEILTGPPKLNKNYLLWGWPVKIIHSIGSSIIDNAARNKKNVFKNYNLPIGFINLNINFEETLKVKPQLMPYSTFSFISLSAKKNYQFEAEESILLGSPIFVFDSTTPNYDIYKGQQFANGITLSSRLYNNFEYRAYNQTIAHEYIHVLQFREYQVFNSYFSNCYNKIIGKKAKLNNFISEYIYSDFPYASIFYLMMQQPKSAVYSNAYFKNLYELEAQHFSTNSFVPHN